MRKLISKESVIKMSQDDLIKIIKDQVKTEEELEKIIDKIGDFVNQIKNEKEEEKIIKAIKDKLEQYEQQSPEHKIEHTIELIYRRIQEKTTGKKVEKKEEIKRKYENAIRKYLITQKFLEHKKWWAENEADVAAVDAFTNLGTNDFKLHCIQLSQLLSEVWINTERGEAFREALNKGLKVEKALGAISGIQPIAKYIEYDLDTSCYNGSMIPREKLHEGLNFTWNLPFAPCPSSRSMNIEEVIEWVYMTLTDWILKHEDMREWLEDEKNKESRNWLRNHVEEEDLKANPFENFPKPQNTYIPLATT